MYRARVRSAVGAWVLLLVCGGATRGPMLDLDPAQERALAATAGPAFRVKRTSHFLIAYDTEPEVVDELTARLEQTYHMVFQFCEMNGVRVDPPRRRLEVIFFNQRAAYERYVARLGINAAGTFGLYHQDTNVSFFFNAANDDQVVELRSRIAEAGTNIDKLERSLQNLPPNNARMEVRFSDGERIVGTKAEIEKRVARKIDAARAELKKLESRRIKYCEQINQTVIQHETAHQTLFNAGLHVRGASNPRWLVEGLACLFETPPGPPGSGVSILNSSRLDDFRSAIDDQAKRQLTSRDYQRALREGRICSPRELILNPGLLDARRASGLRSYAVAWAMTHYLHRNQREQLAAYLLEVSRRKPGDNPSPQQELEIFERHFGPIDDAFLRKMSTYILGLATRTSSGP